MRKLCSLILLAVPAIASAAPGELDTGLWQITTQVNMPGQPAMPAMTMQHCVSEADAKDPAKAMAAADQQLKAHNCQLTDRKLGASSVSFRMQCKGQTPFESVSNFSYTRSSYQGTVKMSMNGMNITSQVSGKRVGPCQGQAR